MTLTVGYVCGFIGAGLTVASYMMHSMMPLRIVALAANVFFVAYGWIEMALPSLVCYSIMIPINAKKAWAIHKLVQSIERARSDTPLADWLLPHMKRRTAKAGEVLWRQGDVATEMFYLDHGKLRLAEYGTTLEPGVLVGEIGLFAPDNRRTLTLECETDCVLYGLSADGMAQLYYQNPKLGFHVMRLVAGRLLDDVKKAREQNSANA